MTTDLSTPLYAIADDVAQGVAGVPDDRLSGGGRRGRRLPSRFLRSNAITN
ncbi:hypothetical protein AB0C34_22825 [Nocardia sp. NPDC049220]|uniref:hypothetical protein n=1 Tax=Nocardia sp. NPDC049220 TaxID=3155273 RepID=UPI0033C5E308